MDNVFVSLICTEDEERDPTFWYEDFPEAFQMAESLIRQGYSVTMGKGKET